MKNLHAMLITSVMMISGFMVPVQSAQAIQPLITTECYYMFESNELVTIRGEYNGNVSCAPFPQGAELERVLAANGIFLLGDENGIPTEHCETIRIVLTEY